jgi:hypothetical protein
VKAKVARTKAAQAIHLSSPTICFGASPAPIPLENARYHDDEEQYHVWVKAIKRTAIRD